MEEEYRIEKDFLGEKKIEKDAYYGIQTLRAKENFDITHTDMSLFPSSDIANPEVNKIINNIVSAFKFIWKKYN